jgi:glycosyltransferase involved in cell wall biosynthesis
MNRPIHVGLSAQLLSLGSGYRSAGITWYIYHLLCHLPEVDPELRFTVFTSERQYEPPPGLAMQWSRLPTRRPAVRIIWEQLLQPSVARRAALDLIHGLAFVGPIGSACPFVVTVHDLSFLFYPRSFRVVNRLYLRLLTRLSMQRARRVVAVSASTRRDVIRYYGVAEEKVDVVYNGVDQAFEPFPEDQVAAFRARHGLPERFILFVGTLEPRKNVARLIRAYAQLPGRRPPLMLVGGRGWLYDDVLRLVEELGLTPDVHLIGYVPADDLPWWYNAAELFVYPSLYEGFGLPPLEAMACGTPVVASTSSSLPEVVGDAGLLVDPADTAGLTAALNTGLTNASTRARLRAAGLARASQFTWQATAHGTADTYRRALEPAGGMSRV